MSSKPVRYCLSCIEESIDSVGYGYFRHFWDCSNICLIHGQPLKELPEFGFSKTLKAVKRLLNARDCEHSTTLKIQPKKLTIAIENLHGMKLGGIYSRLNLLGMFDASFCSMGP